MDKIINLSGLKLKNHTMVGAGPIKTLHDVLEIAKSDSAAILVGSITIKERLGNKGKTYFSDDQHHFSLNSKGLPNPGIEYYKKHVQEMIKIANDYRKPLIVSIAGFTPYEYGCLAKVLVEKGVQAIEINLGCPNLWGRDGKQKSIASFDINVIKEILHAVQRAIGIGSWVAVKLSPFSDPLQLERTATMLGQSKLINAITTTNTFPNAYYPGSKMDLSGMSGESLKIIGLGQVKQLRKLLPNSISIIGVGGISSKKDVKLYLKSGASAIQITTAYIKEGPKIFKKVSGSANIS